MPIEINGTRLDAFDTDGGAIVTLRTDRMDYGLEMRTFTQSDANAVFFGRTHLPSVPTNLVSHATYLDARARRELVDAPSQFAKRPDAAIFTRAHNLNPNALLLMTGVSPGKLDWTPRLDRAWLRAGAANRADVVVLPACEDETAGDVETRIEHAREVMSHFPEYAQKQIAATLRLDSPHLEGIASYLLDAGEPIATLEVHGFSGALANLDRLHELVGSTEKPTYFVATNAGRKANAHAGSATLALLRWGVQAVAPRVPTWAPIEDGEEGLSGLEWFVGGAGGYLPRSDLTGSWASGCGCPDAPGHITTDEKGAVLYARRRHETWAHVAERAGLESSIRAGAYHSGYRAVRPLLDQSLTAISSA